MSMGCGKRKLFCVVCGKYKKHWLRESGKWECVEEQRHPGGREY